MAAEVKLDQKVDELRVGSTVYSNVVVTGKTPTHLTFNHSRGFATHKVSDISSNSLYRLGYRLQAPVATPPPGRLAGLPQKMPKLAQPLTSKTELQKAQKDLSAQAMTTYKKLDPKWVYAGLAVMVALYLWFCHCCKLICDKAGHPPGILIWIPVLQMIPLFRAAGMSMINLVLLFVPLVGLVVYLVWCFKICQARNQPTWLGIFIFFPVTMFPAILYLAQAGGANPVPAAAPVKIQLALTR